MRVKEADPKKKERMQYFRDAEGIIHRKRSYPAAPKLGVYGTGRDTEK